MNEENSFCLFLNVFFYLVCDTVPENWHICVNTGLTYLLNLLVLTLTQETVDIVGV